MTDSFILPVEHNQTELTFEAALQPWGYTYRILVMVDGESIFFEPDEEGNYRAMITEQSVGTQKINIDLLQSIAASLQQHLR